MKMFLICVLLAVIPVYVHAKTIPREIQIPDEIAREVIEQGRLCIAETDVDIGVILDAREGIFSDDPQFKEFSLCLAKRRGILNDAGDFQIEVLRDRTMKVFNDTVVVQKLIDQCTVKHKTPQETAFKSYECLQKNSPEHLSFKKVPNKGALKEIQIPYEIAREAIAQGRSCINETGVDIGAVFKAKEGIFSDDPKLKEFLFCFAKKRGILNDGGDFQIEVLRNRMMKLFNDTVEVQKLIDQCTFKQNTPQETAFESYVCLQKNLPGHFSFNEIYGQIVPKEIHIPDEIVKEICEHGRFCIKETGVDKATVLKAKEGIFSDDPQLKEFLFCFAKKRGALNDDGDFQIDVLRDRAMKLFNDAAVVEKLIDQCTVKQNTPQETAFKSYVVVCRKSRSTNGAFILGGGYSGSGKELERELPGATSYGPQIILYPSNTKGFK